MYIRMVSGNLSQPDCCRITNKNISGDISLHWHDIHEFDIVLNGTGETVCNNIHLPLYKGMISLLSPKDHHEYHNCDNVQILNVQFREDGISCDILHSIMTQQNRVIYVDETLLNNMISLVELLNENNVGSFYTTYQKKLLECMILTFLSCCSNNEIGVLATTPIQNAVMYINNHFRENPKMSDVASMFFLCDSYFCRLFKRTTGKSYKSYIKGLKLEHSMSLLCSTSLSITEIATHCGYDTISHFNREFKSLYGMPPSYFRKRKNR